MATHQHHSHTKEIIMQSTTNEIIRFEHVSKQYPGTLANNDVSLSIRKGEVFALVGENGAGKSTTMNILTGYLSATEGEVYVDGVSVLDDPTAAKRKIGYLPEQPPLYFDMIR